MFYEDIAFLCVCDAARVLFAIDKFVVNFLVIYDDKCIAELSLQYIGIAKMHSNTATFKRYLKFHCYVLSFLPATRSVRRVCRMLIHFFHFFNF